MNLSVPISSWCCVIQTRRDAEVGVRMHTLISKEERKRRDDHANLCIYTMDTTGSQPIYAVVLLLAASKTARTERNVPSAYVDEVRQWVPLSTILTS